MDHRYIDGFVGRCVELGVPRDVAAAMCKAAQAAGAPPKKSLQHFIDTGEKVSPRPVDWSLAPTVPNLVDIMYPKSSKAIRDAGSAVAANSYGGGGNDASAVEGNLPYAGLSPQEVSALSFLNYLKGGTAGREPSGASGIYLSPELMGYEFLRDPRYVDQSANALRPAGTNLLESVSSGGGVNWNDVDTVTGKNRAAIPGRSVPLPNGFVHPYKSPDAVAPETVGESVDGLGRIEAKRPSSMYPKSFAQRLGAEKNIESALAAGGDRANRSRTLAGNLGTSSFSPDELSAFLLNRMLSDTTRYRGKDNSIDMKPTGQEFEFLRDPKYVDPVRQELTPAGTGILERVSGPANPPQWGKVDNVLGRGVGINGRNVPLPEGFVHGLPSYDTEQKADADRAEFSAKVQRILNRRLAGMTPEERRAFAESRNRILGRKREKR